jgi:hypothetical protein
MEVRDVTLRKAWAWKRHGRPNAVLEEAYELTHPANQTTQNLLQALLICPELPLEKVSELMGLPLAVVQAYEGLFWNVRDRLDDRLYLSRLVYPASRFPEMSPESISVIPQQLLQAAYEYGSNEVLYMAGLVRKRERAGIQNDYAELETAIVDNATTLSRHGALNRKGQPGLNHARSLLLAQKRAVVAPNESKREDVGMTNIGQSAYKELQAVATDEIRALLEDQRAAAHEAAGLPLEATKLAA